jgi:hypothetical protein
VNSPQGIIDGSPVKTKIWPRDSLKYFVEFPIHRTYHPFGLPVEVSTNSMEVIAAAEQSWEPFPKLPYPAEKVHLRIGVAENGRKELPPAPSFRAQRHLITVISDSENFVVCDVKEGFAFCWVTPATAADSAFFRYNFLEVMPGLLHTTFHFAPLHAACVAFEDHGVLLCGDSGAGKSTLSYACAQRGWTFISDDGCNALRKNPGRVVIGNPLCIRLREDAPNLFPQLREHSIVLRQNGEFGFEIPTNTLPEFSTAFQCDVEDIVFLNRHTAGNTQISMLPKEEAQRRFEDVLEYTFASMPSGGGADNRAEMFLANPEAREEQKASIRALLTARVHELRYASLDSAIDCLEALVRSRSSISLRSKGT